MVDGGDSSKETGRNVERILHQVVCIASACVASSCCDSDAKTSLQSVSSGSAIDANT